MLVDPGARMDKARKAHGPAALQPFDDPLSSHGIADRDDDVELAKSAERFDVDRDRQIVQAAPGSTINPASVQAGAAALSMRTICKMSRAFPPDVWALPPRRERWSTARVVARIG
jgi:hypothetical protein